MRKSYKQFLNETGFPDCKEVKPMYRCWWLEKHSDVIWATISIILSIVASAAGAVITVKFIL